VSDTIAEASDIPIAMIVAMAQNRVIGRDNQLPWHLPNDLKYFKATTMGKPIVMGRKTYESIGKPLPGRPNVVVTTNEGFAADGVSVAHSVSEALVKSTQMAQSGGASEVMVIGGAQLYREMLPQAKRLYLTLVHDDVPGDAYFPELDFSRWQQVSRKDFWADGPNPYNYSFTVFERN
jgi:dihydrofolate reductase